MPKAERYDGLSKEKLKRSLPKINLEPYRTKNDKPTDRMISSVFPTPLLNAGRNITRYVSTLNNPDSSAEGMKAQKKFQPNIELNITAKYAPSVIFSAYATFVKPLSRNIR